MRIEGGTEGARRRRVRGLTVALLLLVVAAPGCDCGSGVGGGDADGDVPLMDHPPDRDDSGPESWAEADAETATDADVDVDVGEAEVLADAWPDAPESCTWFEPRTAWTCAPAESYRREPFFAPGHEPLLRLISVYEAHTSSTFVVRLRRNYRPVYLALGSYDGLTWTIVREDGARLAGVLTYGHNPQTVVGADDVPVTHRGLYYPGDCWPFCRDGDPRPVVADAEAATGLPLATFDGCYEADEITLGDVCREECLPEAACATRECGNAGECGYECGECGEGTRCDGSACVPCTASCTGRVCGSDGCGGSCGSCEGGTVCDRSGVCVVPTAFPGCESVAAESHFCLTLLERGIGLLGLDTGTICPLGKAEDLLYSMHGYVHSTGWRDGDLFVCVDHPSIHGLMRFSLIDDSWETAPVLCEAVATWHDALLVLPAGRVPPDAGLVHFASFDDARDGVGEDWRWAPRGVRMVAHDDLLFAARHSTSEIDVHRLPGGGRLRTVTLEGYDDWIWGMSVTDDGLLVVTPGRAAGPVSSFDVETGAARGSVIIDQMIAGLACFARP